jgi:hypothetical protein
VSPVVYMYEVHVCEKFLITPPFEPAMADASDNDDLLDRAYTAFVSLGYNKDVFAHNLYTFVSTLYHY